MTDRSREDAWRQAARHLSRAGPGGPFRWRDGGLAEVADALEVAVRGNAPGAVDAVGGLLRLASALRRRLGSGEAADALVAVIKRVPGAVTIARQHFGSGRAEAARRRFLEATGTSTVKRAPSVADARNVGAGTPLRNVVASLELERRRVAFKKS